MRKLRQHVNEISNSDIGRKRKTELGLTISEISETTRNRFINLLWGLLVCLFPDEISTV